MRVGILGLGLIGGSLLRRLAAEDGIDVRGWDADPAVRAAVLSDGFTVADSPSALSAEADLVFVALPPRATASAVLGALAASDHVVVADVASVKAPVLAEVRAGATPEALARFVPAHPLAGAEATGWEASRADLLDDAVWALCPPAEDAPHEPLLAVTDVLDRLGARLAFCTAEEHDAAVARSSHAPHVVAQALALMADTPLSAVLSGGALKDSTRVAGANPDLWAEVLELNRNAVITAVSQIEQRLAELAAAIEANDQERVGGMWRKAAASRRTADRARWSEPDWSTLATPGNAWTVLLQFGRDGRVVRWLEAVPGGFRCQIG